MALRFFNKLDGRRGKKVIALSNVSIYYTWEKIKSSCHNNKLKISAPTWNNQFELPAGSYLVSDIQDYFEYILKNIGKAKAGNNSESLLNEIRKIVYCLYQSKKITEKVYNNIIKTM